MSSRSGDSDAGCLSCPSAPPEEGAALFGIVQELGRIAYISPAIPVSTTLLRALHSHQVEIENRFRFTGPCMGERCEQWRSDRCSLVDAVVADTAAPEKPELAQCGIRATCRWFAQHRQAACAGCPSVIRKPAGT